jgi:hypothetical protein
MDLRQRKMPELEPELRAEVRLQLIDDGVGAAARGTFVIAIFEEHHRSIGETSYVIARLDRNSQDCHCYFA